MTGDDLRSLREQRGWSQAELARRAHMSRQHLNSLERGHNQIVPRTAQHLQLVLATSVETDEAERTAMEPMRISGVRGYSRGRVTSSWWAPGPRTLPSGCSAGSHTGRRRCCPRSAGSEWLCASLPRPTGSVTDSISPV